MLDINILTFPQKKSQVKIFKNKKLLLLLSLIILSSLFPSATSFENNESLKRRLNFYSKIQQYSNNTMRVGQDKEKGLYCVANDYIPNGAKTIRVPKKLSICPYYIFPFKHEIIAALAKIRGLKETLGVEQRFSVYVLIYYIMYLKVAPRNTVKEYILKHKLSDYYELTEIDDSIMDSFPESMLTMGNFDAQHYLLMRQFDYPMDKDQELEMVFKSVMQDLSALPYIEVMYSWISDFELFKWGYSIVMSRGMSLRLNEYYTLEQLRMTDPNNPPNIKKNIEKNAFICKTIGCPCVIAFIDLCNHYQPKHHYSNDKLPIVLDTSPGFFINNAVVDWLPGEEIVYTYTNEPNNIMLMSHYGFNVKDNFFNEQKIAIHDEYSMSIEQFSLCKELGCFDPKIKSPTHVPKSRQDTINLYSLNEKLLNYGRVKYFKGKLDEKIILKKLALDNKISHLNELSADLFYFRVMQDNLIHQSKLIEIAIKEGQMVQNRLADIEQNWDQHEEPETLWRQMKISGIIFEMDLSYKKIIYRHAHVILNRIVNENYSDVLKLRAKYVDTTTKTN